LYDYSVYGRFLVSLPLLILAEALIDPSLRHALCGFVNARLVTAREIPEFEAALKRTVRLKDAVLPELILFLLACAPLFIFVEQKEWLGAISTWRSITSGGLSLAAWWFAVVSTPIARFVMYRWVWRMFVWAILLRRISQINLHLLPTHPDCVGGIGFLEEAQQRFGILFSAASAAIAGQIANGVAYEGESLADAQFLMLGFVILALVVVFAPLLVFVPKLFVLRRNGLVQYGGIANEYMESFDQKWLRNVRPEKEPLLGTADIQSQADLGTSFLVVKEMSIMPVTKYGVIEVALEAAAPLAVLGLIASPAEQVIQTVLKMIF
jgi:hypothetical protein